MTAIIWKIANIEQNPFDKHSPVDPNALYMWYLQPEGSEWTTGSGMNYSNIMLLMQHFGVSNAYALIGKKFESEKEDASLALNFLLIQVQHGGNYTPPSPETIRQRAAESMARMECPDFSDIDKESVFDAFSEVWDGFRANEIWMNAFKAEISNLSVGQVALIEASVDEIKTRVKGPANYMKLIKGQEVQLVIMGPYSTPITFEE